MVAERQIDSLLTIQTLLLVFMVYILSIWIFLTSGTPVGRETSEKGSKERGTVATKRRGKERKRGTHMELIYSATIDSQCLLGHVSVNYVKGKVVWGVQPWELREGGREGGRWLIATVFTVYFSLLRERSRFVESAKRQESSERERTRRESKRQLRLKFQPVKTWASTIIKNNYCQLNGRA